MTGLTTHVLDTALGKPAEGLRIDLFQLDGEILQASEDGRDQCRRPG